MSSGSMANMPPPGPDNPMPNPAATGPFYGGFGPTFIGVSWAEAGIVTFMLIGRLYVNAFLTHRFGWDFWLVALAFTLGMAGQILLTLCVFHGMGNHLWLLTPLQASKGSLFSWLGQVCSIFSVGVGKFAIVALLLSIQGRTRKVNSFFLLFIGWSNIVLDIIQVCLIFNQCTPVQAIWDPATPGADCSHKLTIYHIGLFQSSWAAMSDFVLAIYPIYMFWDVKLEWRVKLGVCALFTGGVVAGIAASWKTAEILSLATIGDATYAIGPLLIWTQTEAWLVMIVGSVPPLRPLFAKWYKDAITSISSHSKSRTQTGQSHGTVELQKYGRGSVIEKKLGTTTTDYTLNNSESKENIFLGGEHNIQVTTNITLRHENGTKLFEDGTGSSAQSEISNEEPHHAVPHTVDYGAPGQAV